MNKSEITKGLVNQKRVITSDIGSFKDFRVTRNLIPNFSSCLDKTLTTVAEFLKSSSNFSILCNKFTSEPENTPFTVSLHFLLLIKAPVKTPTTNINKLHGATLLPIAANNSFFQTEVTATVANTITEERRQESSRKERKESKLESPTWLETEIWDRWRKESAWTVKEVNL
jgi:hypothetical protein